MPYLVLFLLATLLSISSAFASPADKAGWIPFELRNGMVTIDVELYGTKHKAIIDSGAEINAISSDYVEQNKNTLQFGDKMRIKGVFGEDTKALVNALPVSIFGFKVELDSLAQVNLGETALLLGAPFLYNFIVQFDYPNQKMRLLPHSMLDLKKLANVDLKKSRNRNLPAIKVTLEGGDDLWLTLDTGSNLGLSVSRLQAQKQNWLDGRAAVKHSVQGVTTSGKTESFTIGYLKVGPYELEDVLVTIPAEGDSMDVRENLRMHAGKLKKGVATNGYLGYDILQHFVLTLDTKHWRAHIAVP